MTKKLIIILSCIFVFSTIGFLISYSLRGDAKVLHTINVDKEDKVRIDNIKDINIDIVSADLNIYLVDDDEVKVKYYGTSKCFLCSSSNSYNFDVNGDELKIETSTRSIGIFFYSRLNFDLYLPKQYNEKLFIKGVSSDIIINDMNLKEFEVKTVSGEINLKNITVDNELKLKTTSGDMELNSINANVFFDTISGDIEAEKIKGNFKGKSTSGDIELEIKSNQFEIDIKTISGEVDIDLQNDADFVFIVDTVSGDIDINFSYIVDSNKKHYKSGEVGEGINSVNIITVSGDVIINKLY